jgi:hypothetical protein
VKLKPRRFALISLALLLLCILVCAIWVWVDAAQEARENRAKGRFYELTLENHLQQVVIVRLTTAVTVHEYHRRPCSVLIEGIIAPHAGTLDVKAVDTNWRALDSGQMQLGGDSLLRGLNVQIPLNGATECPSSASGQYVLTATNSLPREVMLSFGGLEIGRVAALAEKSFGPLPGTWEAIARRIEIHCDGHILIRRMYADYDLGQVPHFWVHIDQESP